MKQTAEIDGLDVTSHKFPVFEALRLKAKLVRVVMPILSSSTSALDGIGSVEDLMNADTDQLGPIGLAIAEALEPKQLTALFLDCLRTTNVTIDGPKGPRIIELTSESKINGVVDDVVTLWKIVYFALKATFGDFIEGVIEFLKERLAREPEKDPESQSSDSTPTSEKSG